MFSDKKAVNARRPSLRRHMYLCGLLISCLLWAGPIAASCVATSMEGIWENAQSSGVLQTIEMHFKCCDQIRCPVGGPCVTVCNPSENTVHVHGPCESGSCDWGTVIPDYSFVDAAGGYQYTRVDARFQQGTVTKRLVILLVENDRLLVHWSIDYPEGSPQKDVSLIEYFARARCFIMMGRTLCIKEGQILKK